MTTVYERLTESKATASMIYKLHHSRAFSVPAILTRRELVSLRTRLHESIPHIAQGGAA